MSHYHQYTEEEKKQYRKHQMDDIQTKLEDGVRKFITSDRYAEFLTLMARFHAYSFNNCLLIAMQFPTATLVTGYNTWLKTFHRVVKKGSKGIRILYPMIYTDTDPDTGKETTRTYFRPTSVFDITQTHPVEDMEPVDLDLVHELNAPVRNYPDLIEAIASMSPVPVVYDDISGGAKGFYSPADNRIVIQQNMPQLQTVKTMIHEVTHAVLHNNEAVKLLPFEPDRNDKEIQAESTAFIVTSLLGLDTSDYSFPYVGSYCGQDLHKLNASMSVIRPAAEKIYMDIAGSYALIDPQKAA